MLEILSPGADSLLGHLADTDKKKARSLIDFRSVFERSNDEYLIAMTLLVMDRTVADAQAKSLDVLLNRPDVSDRVKDVAKKRLQQLAEEQAEKVTG